jgi:hypothetical protein
MITKRTQQKNEGLNRLVRLEVSRQGRFSLNSKTVSVTPLGNPSMVRVMDMKNLHLRYLRQKYHIHCRSNAFTTGEAVRVVEHDDSQHVPSALGGYSVQNLSTDSYRPVQFYQILKRGIK